MNPVRSPRSEPTYDQQRRLERQVEEAKEQGRSLVPGHYLISWKKEAFPYSLKREGETWAERVHSSGKTLNQLSRELVSSVGGELTYTYNIAAAGFAAFLSLDQVETLRHHPDVAAVEPDLIFENAGGEQSITDPGLWGLDRIDEHNISSENVYRYPRTGAGVHAYVIDSGIRETHDEFNNPNRMGNSFGTGYSWHGTQVASVLGGNTFGVAKGVTLHSVMFPYLSSALASLIGYVITEHELIGSPAVVNMSFGYGPTDSNYDNPALFETSINSLMACGFVVVAAAGNDKNDLSVNPFYPASFENVISVGAIDVDDVVWDNLNWKEGIPEEYWDYGSNFGPEIDIWAPGIGIRAANDNCDSCSNATNRGTSYAAPHVSGVAALYLEANPTAEHDDVKSYLLDTATMGKITGNLNGAPNRLLFHNSWFYPFHTYEEWVNSDPEASCSTSDCWIERAELGGWVWTDADSYNNGGWFYRLVDQSWIALVSTTPCILFWNDSTQQYETCLDP